MLQKSLLVLIILIPSCLSAVKGVSNSAPGKKYSITGNIVDETQQGVPFADILVYNEADSGFVEATISDGDGLFTLELSSAGVYRIQIRMIGFENSLQKHITLNNNEKNVDLGTIVLSADLMDINEVQVVGEKQAVEFKIDRKVINIDKLPNAAGGTLAEALEDVPSIKTDLDGNVLLRGSTNFKVYVDGKPSLLDSEQALKQFPADAVERVELITNPSARYDADGGAGIINIILKKNRANGFNALLHGSLSSGNKYSGDLLMNYKFKKINFFIGADYRKGLYAGNGNVYSEYSSGSTNRYEEIELDQEFHENDYIWTFGMDIDISEKNTFSLTGEIKNYPHKYYNNSKYSGWTDEADTIVTMRYNDKDIAGSPIRFTFSDIHKFNNEGHELSSYAFVGYKTHIDYHEFERDTIQADTIASRYFYRRETERPELETRLNITYTRPFSEDSKIEGGYQFTNQSTYYRNTEIVKDINDSILSISTEGSDLDYIKEEQAGFINYTNKINSFSFQIGLRAEFYKQYLRRNKTEYLTNIKKLDWFPSIFISRVFKNEWQINLNYGRRMNRLSIYSLSPLVYFDDGSFVYMGNPNLLPAYINNFEAELIGKVPLSSFVLSTYLRDITNSNFGATRIEGEKRIRYPENIDKEVVLGVELSIDTKFSEYFKLQTSSSFYHEHVEGTLNNDQIDNSGYSWDIQLQPVFVLKTKTRIQLQGYYQAPSISVQGSYKGFFVSSLSIKQQLLKDQLTITFRIRDIFKTRKYESITRGSNFYSESSYTPESPIVTLSVGYNLNSYKSKSGRGQVQDSGSGGGGSVF